MKLLKSAKLLTCAIVALSYGSQVVFALPSPGTSVLPPTQMSIACSRFVNSCYQAVPYTADGADVKHVCKKGKGRETTKFTFKCSYEGTDYTRKALNIMARSASTEQTDPVIVTQTVNGGNSFPEQTSTTTIASTLTVIESITATATLVAVSITELPTTTLIPPVQRRATSRLVDDSTFCQAYADSCSRQCSKKASNTTKTVCTAVAPSSSKAAGLTFNLQCSCPSSVTQHALAVIGTVSNVPSTTVYTTQAEAAATTVVTELVDTKTTATVTASTSIDLSTTISTSTVLSSATPSAFIVMTSDNRYLYTSSYTNPRAQSGFGGVLISSSLSDATRYTFDRTTGHVCEVDQDYPLCWSGNNIYGPHAASFMSQTDEWHATSPYAYEYVQCTKAPSTLTGTLTCTLDGSTLSTIYVRSDPQDEYPCIGDSVSSGCSQYFSSTNDHAAAVTLTYQYVL